MRTVTAVASWLKTSVLISSLTKAGRNMSVFGASMKEGPECMDAPARGPFRLPAVLGAEPGMENELLVMLPGNLVGGKSLAASSDRRCVVAADQLHHVIYFPGDVQSYYSVMAQHPENVRWQQWSLDDVAVLLSRRFPRSCVWIIKASRMHLHKFSCYDHFVQSSLFGAPEHSTDFGAFRHLHRLLTNAFQITPSIINLQNGVQTVHKVTHGNVLESHSVPAANGFHADGDGCSKEVSFVFSPPHHSDCVTLTLIGFSKGCVVLNQLLYELQEAKSDKTLAAFIKNIKAIYWLDGGHPGGGNTWVTDTEVLKEFAETGIAVHTHVTPYQVRDSMRSWIGKEHCKFVQTLRELGMQVDNQIHFESEVPTLENHFRVLEVF